MASQTASCVVVRDAKVVAVRTKRRLGTCEVEDVVDRRLGDAERARGDPDGEQADEREAEERTVRDGVGQRDGEGSVGRYEDVDDFDVVAARGPETDGVPGVDDLPVARLEEGHHDLRAVGCHRHLVAVEHDARRRQPGALVAVADEGPSAADEVATVAFDGAPGRGEDAVHDGVVAAGLVCSLVRQEGVERARDPAVQRTPGRRAVVPGELLDGGEHGGWIRFEPTEVARPAEAEEARVRQRLHRRGGQAALTLALLGRLPEHGADPACRCDEDEVISFVDIPRSGRHARHAFGQAVIAVVGSITNLGIGLVGSFLVGDGRREGRYGSSRSRRIGRDMQHRVRR